MSESNKMAGPTIVANRNYGVDLLRIVSMFYIVMLHTLGMGGIVGAAQKGSAHRFLGLFWEMWVYCALDIFALVSGYVSYREQEQKYNYGNYLVLWLQVVTYSAAAAVIYQLFNPGRVSAKDYVEALMPVTGNSYWYFTAYTGLFFLIPFINAGVRGSSRGQLHRLVAVILVLFSLYSTVADRWQLQDGFSCFWLVILYLIGATAKKCGWEEKISIPLAVAGIVLCTCFSWGWKLLEEYRPIFGKSMVETTYLTPTHVVSAILHLLLFAKLRIPQRLKKWIAFAAPGTFAVYLLNCNRFIWDSFVLNRFGYLAEAPLGVMVVTVLGTSAAFVLFAVVVDYFRRRLFHLLKVRQGAQRIVDACFRLVEHMEDYFFIH